MQVVIPRSQAVVVARRSGEISQVLDVVCDGTLEFNKQNLVDVGKAMADRMSRSPTATHVFLRMYGEFLSHVQVSPAWVFTGRYAEMLLASMRREFGDAVETEKVKEILSDISDTDPFYLVSCPEGAAIVTAPECRLLEVAGDA